MKLNNEYQCMEANSSGGNWKVLYWVLGALCMPLVFPWVLLYLWRRRSAEKHRNSLPGKVVLITGASSGLGESLAHVFYKAGCKVILSARRLEELERVKRELLALDMYPITYPPSVLTLDLADLNDMPEFVKRVLSVHNHVDILVNNGGVSVRANVYTSAVDIDMKVMVVNYFGTVALTKALLPSMIERGTGHICFISSIQGKCALPQRSSYSASKHAVQAFSDSLRAEVASKNISVTCVSPGYIRTQLSLNALTATGKAYGKMDKTTAAGMDPEKMAERILDGILRNDKDIVVCDVQAKLAMYTRTLCPSLYFYIMEKRALNLEKADQLEQKKQELWS